jgi:hypothetical protein
MDGDPAGLEIRSADADTVFRLTPLPDASRA